jgi:membrane protease YdiL (CAAX protease family)
MSYIISGIPLYVGLLLMRERSQFFSSLGLNGSLKKGILFPLLVTTPMLIGYAMVFRWNEQITADDILISAVAAAFFEELFFRGFLFGMVYRFTKFGFIPAILPGAVLFGLVHLYQSSDLLSALGVFLVTFLGALLFAWLYAEWNYNIWVPVFLHFFMNLFWMLFDAGDNALGGIYANIFRFTTIASVLIGTIVYKRKSGLTFEVSGKTLWIKKNSSLYS